MATGSSTGYINVSVDLSSVGWTARPGTIAKDSTGIFYTKFSTGDTDWSKTVYSLAAVPPGMTNDFGTGAAVTEMEIGSGPGTTTALHFQADTINMATPTSINIGTGGLENTVGGTYEMGGMCDMTFAGVVTTTNNTLTQCAVYDPAAHGDPSQGIYKVRAFACGLTESANQGAGYEIAGTFRIDNGTMVQVGSSAAISTQEDDSNWNATLDTSADTIRLMVSGVDATTIRWVGRGMIVAKEDI